MTRNRYNWTQEKLFQIADMVEAGMTRPEIAERMGASIGAVEWQILRLGVTGPRSVKLPQLGGSYIRRGRVVRRFTPEEDAHLLRLEAEGLTATQIGRQIGRAHHTVMGRLSALARHEQLDEQILD